jgi:hypothetical protein
MFIILAIAVVSNLPKLLGTDRVPWLAWALLVVSSIGAVAAGVWWEEHTRWPRDEYLRGDPTPPKKEDPPKADQSGMA